MSTGKLSLQQQKFAREYLIDKNATQAAIRSGYSAKTAHSSGPRLLAHVGIQQLVNKTIAKSLNKLDVSVERILQERARAALYDIGDVAIANVNSPADIASLPYDVRSSITGWKWDKEGRFVVEMADKNAHLTALEKHLGMYSDNASGNAVLNIIIHA